MKDVVEKEEKIFTKKNLNNIINENYNPLKVNCKLICEREGLYMEEQENIVLREVIEKPNFIQKIIFKILKKSFIEFYKAGIKKGFNWNNNVR